MSKNKVLVIGERCKDVFVYGKSNRKSPEGKGPVFIPTKEVVNGGMAVNTFNNLAAMGLEVDIITDTGYITKTRYINEDTNELYLRIDTNDETKKIHPSKLKDFSKYSAIIISDYCKGFLDEEDIDTIASSHDLVILDTKKRLGDWCRNLTFIKINRNEYNNNKDIISENEWLNEKLIVTMDGDGAMYNGKTFPTENVESADVSGAGDTFVAGFVKKYLETKEIETSINWGNYCASEVVKEKGVSIFRK